MKFFKHKRLEILILIALSAVIFLYLFSKGDASVLSTKPFAALANNALLVTAGSPETDGCLICDQPCFLPDHSVGVCSKALVCTSVSLYEDMMYCCGDEDCPRNVKCEGLMCGGGGVSPPTGDLTWPVPGSPSPEDLKDQCFGWRPWTDKKGKKHCSFHSGIDISVGVGTSVVAAAPGKVVLAQKYGDWGNAVIIEHEKPGGGKFYTLYSHLKCNGFKVGIGDFVSRGQEIGLSGGDDDCKGYSTGPHLHFEIREGGNDINNAANPCLYFQDGYCSGCVTECQKYKENTPSCNDYKNSKC
jgi:hypothetical protein